MITKEQAMDQIRDGGKLYMMGQNQIVYDVPTIIEDGRSVLLPAYGMVTLDLLFLTKEDAAINFAERSTYTLVHNIRNMKYGRIVAMALRDIFDKLYVELWDEDGRGSNNNSACVKGERFRDLISRPRTIDLSRGCGSVNPKKEDDDGTNTKTRSKNHCGFL
jgi:hypothetical protein